MAAEILFRKSYLPAAPGLHFGGRDIAREAFYVIVNQNKFSVIHCGSAAPSQDKVDFETVALHEYGHVLGLDHDLADTANVTVVNNPLYYGQMKRTLTARDVDRAIYRYGADPL